MKKAFYELEQVLANGEFKAGEILPSASELSERFGCSEQEIEEALSELIYEGSLERVLPQPMVEIRVPAVKLWNTLRGSHSITKEAKKLGVDPGVKIIRWELVDVWPDLGRRLALAPGEKVQIMERLRYAGDEPVAIEVSYFPAKFYPGITEDLFTEEGTGISSFKVMEEKFGLKSQKATDELTVVCLEKREADYMEMAPGTPILERFRVTLSDKGEPIKASRAIWKFRAGYEMPV